MHSYLLEIAYHGAAYSGWQRQEGQHTVQARLEAALQTILGEPVVVHGAGRTDAGVHALRQCAHVRLPREYPCQTLRDALNGNLPRDICVRRVREVDGAFHARFTARGKRYVYRCIVSRLRPVHTTGLAHWVRRPVDLDRMRRASAHLVGRHDFASFATNPGYRRSRGTVREIQRLHLMRRPHGFDLFVQGDGFLYNMVRAIAGTLIEVGLGKRRPDDVATILAAKDRRRAGPCASADGLYLLRVLYPRSALGASEEGGDVARTRREDGDQIRLAHAERTSIATPAQTEAEPR